MNSHLLAWCLQYPWAITRAMMPVLAHALARHVAHIRIDQAEIDEMKAATSERRAQSAPTTGNGAVAVIPVHGVLAPRANMMTDVSGMASYDVIADQVRRADANAAIASILLDVDSPGGSVAGCAELAAVILDVRQRKPIVAHANFLMGSAAYWIGACATEVVASESAVVGSVGVFCMHDDLSEALKMEGVNREYVVATASPRKIDVRDDAPLSDEARAMLLAMADEWCSMFIRDIAAGRRVSTTVVAETYGQGMIFSASDALAAGMIDRVESVSDTVRRLAAGELQTPRRQMRAETPGGLWRAQVDLQMLELELSSRG